MDGNKLKKLRKDKGFTQADVANVLGVTGGTISMWETSKREPSRKNLVSLSKLYEVSIEDFLQVPKDEKKDIPSNWNLSFEELPSIIQSLDLYGQKVVLSVIQIERDRCQSEVNSNGGYSIKTSGKNKGV